MNFTLSLGLTLGTLVVPGAYVPEGALIEAVAEPWFDIAAMMQTDPNCILQLSPRQWEEIIAGAHKAAGYEEVILTPRSGDLGSDVIAVKHGMGTVRGINQMKAYRPRHLVTADDVRSLIGVLSSEQASKAFLTTTSGFAPRLKDDVLIRPWMPSKLELIDGDGLVTMLKGHCSTSVSEAAYRL